MERMQGRFPLAAILLMIGAASLAHFGGDVRSVDAVGLSGAGFSLGVGFALLVFGIAGRSKA